jgi:hypothetical protein
MNAQQVDSITQNISDALVTAGTVGEAIAPQYMPAFALGIAVAKALPELEKDIASLLAAKEPTAEDKQLLAQKIAALTNPENL